MDRAVIKVGDGANQPAQPQANQPAQPQANQPAQQQPARNEIEDYVLARYISAGSAIWRYIIESCCF